MSCHEWTSVFSPLSHSATLEFLQRWSYVCMRELKGKKKFLKKSYEATSEAQICFKSFSYFDMQCMVKAFSLVIEALI